MKPVLGVTAGLDEESVRIQLRTAYASAIVGAGGIPVVLPINTSTEDIGDLLDRVDGVVLSGGGDIDPSLFGEEPHQRLGDVNLDWDTHDIFVARYCLAARVPVLGICRGCQVLNVAAGGTLYQDIGAQVSKAIKHPLKTPRWQPGHTVNVLKDSVLARILDTEMVSVNSFHHQAIKKVGRGFVASAWAMDGVIEGIEAASDHPFAVGVQWHPEGMWERYEVHQRPFRAIVAAAKEFRAGRTGGV